MKKMIKLSLVAAVAVAGLTTTSSAKSLEDAIKNVDVSGYVRYRYTNADTGTESNAYRLTSTLKSKVNDNVTAKLVFLGNGATTDASGDADPVAANIVEANFVYTNNGITAIVGKQALATPFADGGVDSQQGSGIVVLAPVGPVTLAGGFYTNSDAKAMQAGTVAGNLTGNNIGALAVMGKAANIDYAVWYANISENGGTVAGAGATAVNLNLKGKFGPVSVETNYASVDYTGTIGDTLKDQEQSRIVVSADVNVATVTAGYVVTGTDGGDVTLGDTDAKANFVLEDLSASATKNDTVVYLGVKAPVGPVKVGVEYATADKADAAESKISVAYAMSKNFKISAFQTGADYDKSRVEVKYTF